MIFKVSDQTGVSETDTKSESVYIFYADSSTMQLRVVLFIAAVVLLLQQTTSSGTSASFYYDALDPQSNPFTPSNFTTYGSGFVNGSGLILTQKGDPFGTVIFYNQPVPLGNGFTTEFVIQITNCDSNYGGADGFAFVLFPQLPATPFYVPGGSNIGVTTSTNLAVVGFILVNDILTVCAVNSSANLGSGSLKDDTTHCYQNTNMNSVLKDLRCNGSHIITITYQQPGFWEIVFDHKSTYTYTFSKDLLQNLNWNDSNYMGYVGFSGGVGAGWMDQKIATWSFATYSGCTGACAANAICNFVNNTAFCSCPEGYVGDGNSPCIPIRTSANIVPILECYEKFGDGSYEAYYGYDSLEIQPVIIPRGVNNEFYGYNGTIDPTEYFLPGRTPFYPANAFVAELTLPTSDPITLTWRLGDYEVSFRTDDLTKRCSQDLSVLLRFTTGRQLDANETSLILDQLYTLIGVSYGRISIRGIAYSAYMKRQSATELADLELEISGTNSTTQNEPRAAQAVQNLIDASSNTTRMNEVINPDPNNQDPDRNFLGVKTTSSGTETVGQVVPQPVAPTNSAGPTTTVTSSATSVVAVTLGNVLILAIATSLRLFIN